MKDKSIEGNEGRLDRIMFREYINLPNVLTSIRLGLSPVIAILLVFDSPFSRYAVLLIVLFSEFTDMADGYFARKHGQVTDLGKLLDPMADSIYRDTMFLSLAVIHQVSIFLVLPILYRDSIVSTLRTVCAYNGIVQAARLSGKIKAIVQATVIILILILRIYALHYPGFDHNLMILANLLLCIACAATLYSGYDYLSHILPRVLTKSS